MKQEIRLSKRQQEMLQYIHENMEHEHRPPTIREIGGALDISSTSVVNYNLNRLKEKGLLLRDKTVSRGLRLTDQAMALLEVPGEAIRDGVATVAAGVQNLVRIPILGNIVAGEPIDVSNESFTSYDEEDFVEMSTTMLPARREALFALRVDGYSMIDDMISDGDIVILQKQETANDGDVVAVWVEGEGTTLKRLYRDRQRGQVRLEPRNPEMKPIYVDPEQVTIQGKLVLTLSQAN